MSIRDVWSRDATIRVVELGEAGLTFLSVLCIIAAGGLGLLAAYLINQEESG